MINANFKKYKDFDDFLIDFMFVVMEDDLACVVINYNDCQGLVQALQAKVVNNKSLVLDAESFDGFDEAIDIAKSNGGNMLITVFKDHGEIIVEPILYRSATAYAPATYYVECDAKSALDIPFNGTVIPFMIEKEKI